MKKFFKILIIVILIILIIGIAAVAIFLKSKLNKINYENVTKEDIEVNEGVEELLTGYTNIALLGLDARDNTFENSRSDCIMIISINNETKDVKGLDKVTHAYAYGKAPLSLSTINTNLDLDITKYVTINFESVISIVDAIGGVQVELTKAEATQVPGISEAGTYNLTGAQALAYGRIRKIDNDYVRTERMRTVLIKVFEKAKTLPLAQLNTLIDKMLPEVSTNIPQKEILTYASKINQYNVVDNFGWPYEVRGYTGAAWYAAPVTLEANVRKLHESLFENEEYEVSEKVKEISNKIINKTGYRN